MASRDIDFEDREIQPKGHHIARQADITLATADDLQFGVDDAYGYDLGPSDGIGSEDYELGLSFGDPETPRERSEAADDMSVEVGRDAAPPRAPRESLDSHLLGQGVEELELLSHHSRAPSEHPFADDMGFGFGPEDGLNIDLHLDLDDHPVSDGGKTPGQTRSPSRACASDVDSSSLRPVTNFSSSITAKRSAPYSASRCRDGSPDSGRRKAGRAT